MDRKAQSLLNAFAIGLGSALHICAAAVHFYSDRHLTCLQMLLDSGANVNEACEDMGTPLHLASRSLHRNMDAVRLLLKHGADPNAKDHRGNSPLHYAIVYQAYDLVETLVDHGADLKGPIGEYGNAAKTAADWYNRRATAWINDLCADVDEQESNSGGAARGSSIRRPRWADYSELS